MTKAEAIQILDGLRKYGSTQGALTHKGIEAVRLAIQSLQQKEVGCKCKCHSYPQHGSLQDALDGLHYLEKQYRELQLQKPQLEELDEERIESICIRELWHPDLFDDLKFHPADMTARKALRATANIITKAICNRFGTRKLDVEKVYRKLLRFFGPVLPVPIHLKDLAQAIVEAHEKGKI